VLQEPVLGVVRKQGVTRSEVNDGTKGLGRLRNPLVVALRRHERIPWVGVWERINIGVFLLGVVVLAIMLLRARDTPAVTSRQDARVA
jgi:hypothetical protein